MRSYPSFKCLHHESLSVTNSMSVPDSSPPLCSRRPSEGRRHRETRQWGKEEREGESTFFLLHLNPLSGCHVLFVSRGRLSSDGDGARGSLAWMANGEDLVARSKVLCAHMGERARESAMEGDAEREREKQTCTHSAMSLTWESFRQA